MKRILVMAAITAALAFGAHAPVAHAETTGKTNKQTTATKKETKEPEPVMVTVEKGDSLSKIAVRHNTTWVRIFNANESVENPDLINPGDELRIPREDEELPDRDRPEQTVAVKKTTSTTRRSSTTARTTTNVSVSPNDAKSYIYARESGNNPNATNPQGCYGIGQDCNGVVRAQCGADYACQDAYFTNYAMRRYGSWENALAFWQSHHWW